MNEIERARRTEDKRPVVAVDWTDAPRFTALGIAETWAVTVEAEGQRVVRISDQNVTSLDGDLLGQFFPTIRSCAQHLLGFIGAAPVLSTVGAAKGGITSDECRSASAAEKPTGDLTDEQIGELWAMAIEQFQRHEAGVSVHPSIYLARAVERAAIAAHLERQAQQAERDESTSLDLHNAIMNLPCKRDDASFLNEASRQLYKEGHRDARHAAAELALAHVSQEGAHAARNAVLEEAALAAEKVQDVYRERQSGKWPELRDDAETGAGDCVAVIRGLKTPASAERSGDHE